MKLFSDNDHQINFKTRVLLQRTITKHQAAWIEELPDIHLTEMLEFIYQTEFMPKHDTVLLDLISDELKLPPIPAVLSNAAAVTAYDERHKEICKQLAIEAKKQILAEREILGDAK